MSREVHDVNFEISQAEAGAGQRKLVKQGAVHAICVFFRQKKSMQLSISLVGRENTQAEIQCGELEQAKQGA